MVACPHYLGECVEWTGFAVATRTRAGWAFAFWTFANLMPRARAAYREWYRGKFKSEYPHLSGRDPVRVVTCGDARAARRTSEATERARGPARRVAGGARVREALGRVAFRDPPQSCPPTRPRCDPTASRLPPDPPRISQGFPGNRLASWNSTTLLNTCASIAAAPSPSIFPSSGAMPHILAPSRMKNSTSSSDPAAHLAKTR